MTDSVDRGCTRDLGEGRWVRATAASQGGWWISLMEGADLMARVRLKPDDFRRVSNGKVTTESEVEMRGMRSEVEFRVSGRILGRIPKDSFSDMIAAAGTVSEQGD